MEKEQIKEEYRLFYDGKLWGIGASKADARSDFYKSRFELQAFYRLDHCPKYSDLKLEIDKKV